MNAGRRLPTALLAAWLGLLAGCVVVPPGEQPPPAPANPVTEDSPAKADGEPVSPLPGVTGRERATRRLTAPLLQSELLAFTDRYLEAIAEAADWGADHSDDPKARAAFRQTKVVYASAAVTSATEPDPLRVLRDLLVMLRLQRMVWEDGNFAWATPEARARMVHALVTLEHQMQALAARVVPAEAIALINEATAQWHANNPGRRYVSFVRFHDLGDADFRRRFEEHLGQQGLLAPIAEASREIQETRLVAERGLFLVNHMPMLLEWQAEGLIYHTLRMPETREILTDLDRLISSAESVATQIALLPDHVARERQDTLLQVDSMVTRQREQSFATLEAAAGQLLPLVQQLDATAVALRETMAMITAINDAPDEPGDFTMQDFATMVERMAVLASDAAEVMRMTQAVMDRGPSAEGTARLDELLRAHELRLFGYLCGLIVLLGLVLCAVILVWRRTASPGK